MSDEITIGQCIKQLLHEHSGNEKLLDFQVSSAWNVIVGKSIAAQTDNIRLNGDTLFVYISNPVLRVELFYSKSKLIKSINVYLKRMVISQIRFL
ncbi:MAG: DUF721 domain-containing protein [Bacteroidales bacterium]|jgi:hypothetical protein|nr:DUF721 domain-containing protein [Bacteroidales bacterium]